MEVFYLEQKNNTLCCTFASVKTGGYLTFKKSPVPQSSQRIMVGMFFKTFCNGNLLLKHFLDLAGHAIHGFYDTAQLFCPWHFILNFIPLFTEGICLSLNFDKGFKQYLQAITTNNQNENTAAKKPQGNTNSIFPESFIGITGMTFHINGAGLNPSCHYICSSLRGF